MSEIAKKMEGKTPRELLTAGARAYATSNYNAAVQYLSRASELTVTEQKTHTHDSLGEIYFLYGKSLLELSREEGDPLGDVVPKDVAIVQEAEEEPTDGVKDDAPGSKDDDSDEEEEDEEEEDEEEEEEEEEEGEEEEEEEKREEKSEEKKDDEQVVEGGAKGVEFNGETENSTKAEKKEDDSGDKAEAGSSEEKPPEPEEEIASDLQVAWEVLELAKIIFLKRGEDAKSDLSETLITLGEVSLESENFESAVVDIAEGLEIQKILYDDTDRTLAETHYKLGMALSMNNKLDEAIENFNRSIQLLKNRIDMLKNSEKSIEKKEVEDMKQLIPEIEEKIVDLRNYNEEVANKEPQEARPILPGSPEKKATNISHLVKRKRKSEEGEGSSNSSPPAKKSAINLLKK